MKKLIPEAVTDEQADKSAGEEEEGDEEDVDAVEEDHESSDMEDDYFGDRIRSSKLQDRVFIIYTCSHNCCYQLPWHA